MTKLTYTLAIINGTVCYECQPSTPTRLLFGRRLVRPVLHRPRTHPQKHRQSITNI